MKKIYVITILHDGLVSLFQVDESNAEKIISTELGGWNNLHGAMTSGLNTNSEEFYQTGVTKDNRKAFSIICRLTESEESSLEKRWDKLTKDITAIEKEVHDNFVNKQKKN